MPTVVRGLGLRQKLLLLAFLILLPLSALQALSIWNRISEQIAAEKQHNQEAAELIAVDFTRYLNNIWNTEAGVGALLTGDDAPVGRAAMDRVLEGYRLPQPTVKCLSWFGPDGKLLATNYPNSPDVSGFDREYFQAIVQGQDRVVSDLLVSRFDGIPSIAVASGIRRDDELVGVVLACINLDALNEAFAPLHQNTGSYMLIDTTGRVVSHSARPELPTGRRDLSDDSPVRQVLANGQPLQFESTLVDIDHTNRLGAAVPIPGIGWVAVASHPAEEVLAIAYQDALLQGGIFAVFAAASFAGVIFIGHRILQPIHAVQQAARQLAAGDLTARAGTFADQDELETMATNFDQMARRLQAAETDRTQLLVRLTGQKQVLELIATGAALSEILTAIVSLMEELVSDSICAVAVLEPSGELRVIETAQLQEWYDHCRGNPWNCQLDAIARAAREGTLISIAEIDANLKCAVGTVSTLTGGIDGNCCTPILGANGEALGVLVTCCPNQRLPSPFEETLAKTLAHLAGIAIERLNSEEARNRKLQLLIDHMAEGVIAIDEEEQVLVVNTAASRLLDLQPLPEAPTLATAGFPPQLAEALRSAAVPESLTPALCTISGANRELDVHVSPVVTGMGRHYGAIALLHDVTASAQLRKLQESFVANVSHELRAPLTSLSVMAEAINDGLVKGKTRERYLRSILMEVNRLRSLTNDILELSRLDARVVELSREELDIDLVFESIHENWSLRCSAANIALKVERPGARVIADYDRVLQVMTNLLDNAVKFTPAGGGVWAYAGPEGGYLKIAVADTGIGIPKDHLPHIWQRFYIADGARTRTPFKGAGLGLAIARQLVELMGGKVGVESDPGMGSVFTFSLPLAGFRSE